jgi:hypothetical protein
VTLTEMRTAVRTRIGNPSTDGFFTDAQLTDLINEALAAVSAEEDWPWLQTSANITTVAGTAAYAAPAGWVHTKQLYINLYDPMIYLSLAEIDSISTTDTGQPQMFTVYDEDIVLRPVPDAVYTVVHQYNRSETALAADGDTPLMPSIFHYAIVTLAAKLAHDRQRDLQRSQIEEADYQGWLRRMRNYRYRLQGPLRPRIRPGSSL